MPDIHIKDITQATIEDITVENINRYFSNCRFSDEQTLGFILDNADDNVRKEILSPNIIQGLATDHLSQKYPPDLGLFKLLFAYAQVHDMADLVIDSLKAHNKLTDEHSKSDLSIYVQKRAKGNAIFHAKIAKEYGFEVLEEALEVEGINEEYKLAESKLSEEVKSSLEQIKTSMKIINTSCVLDPDLTPQIVLIESALKDLEDLEDFDSLDNPIPSHLKDIKELREQYDGLKEGEKPLFKEFIELSNRLMNNEDMESIYKNALGEAYKTNGLESVSVIIAGAHKLMNLVMEEASLFLKGEERLKNLVNTARFPEKNTAIAIEALKSGLERYIDKYKTTEDNGFRNKNAIFYAQEACYASYAQGCIGESLKPLTDSEMDRFEELQEKFNGREEAYSDDVSDGVPAAINDKSPPALMDAASSKSVINSQAKVSYKNPLNKLLDREGDKVSKCAIC